MKLPPGLKLILLMTLTGIYCSGATTWVLDNWFLVDSGLGPEPSPFHKWWMQIHATIGLSFLVLFGYLLHAHVRPAWRLGHRRVSGFFLTAGLVFLMMTVPFLFYWANEEFKDKVEFLHTYVGLSMIVPFAIHYVFRKPGVPRGR